MMIKRLLPLSALLLMSLVALAQQPVNIQSDATTTLDKLGQPSRTTGTITTSSSTIALSVSGYGVATVTVNGTYAGVTINFEFSDDGGTTYYSETCSRTDTNLQESSEALPSNQTRAWDCGVYAASNFRVRSSAYTSGTANVGITLSTASIEPAATVSGSGNFNTNTAQVGGNTVAADASGRQIVKVYPDTGTTSYHASKKFAASSTTDVAVLPGNATNTVLVTRVLFTCTQTTAGILNLELVKRSTADTSGTSASMTVVPDDSSYAAGSSAPLSYTGTGPTTGTAVGDLDNAQVGCLATTTAAPNDIYIFKPLKPIVLRGTAQQLAINLGGAVTGGNITVTFEWMETTTP